MKKKTFDEICEKILGEAVPVPPANSSQPTVNKAPVAQNPVVQKPNTPQPTPAANQTEQPEIADDVLMKALQQRMADAKFKESLLQMLNSQTNG